MRPRSIRWQLPVSYGAIALLSTLALGLALLVTLRDYYMQRELNYLQGNAQTINYSVAEMMESDIPMAVIQAQLASYSFLSQVRLRMRDIDGIVLADSGVPRNRNLLSISAQPGVRTVPQSSARTSTGITLSALDPYIDIGDYRTRIDMPIGIPVDDVETGQRVTEFYVPVITLERIYPDTTDSVLANEAANTKGTGGNAQAGFTSVLAATGTISGFSLGDETTGEGERSDQIVVQTLYSSAGDPIGLIELSEGPAYGRQIVSRVAQGWLFASTLAVAIAGFAGLSVSRRITVPLMELTEATTRMSRGDLTARADLDRDDELGQLATAFNEMARRIEEIVVTLRRFVADAAHELHTPLTALHTNLELASDELNQKTRQAYIERAQSQVKRLETLTDGLLHLSRMESGTVNDPYREVSLSALLLEVSELYASRSEQAGINFMLDLPKQPIMVYGSSSQLRNALGNLLDNAIKFSPIGETITVALQESLGDVAITIQDHGIGIPPDEINTVFSRFHRCRNAADYPGSGLGLAIVKHIVEAHRGAIYLQNRLPGLCVTLILPNFAATHVPERVS
ncbi:MAG: HAMP domain-containing histidine kinase [Chitinophagaceae bacterium]|nr:HAMP domain-containing histidine kinase [Anaerolineae bacterium]